ncbi:PBSX family phage terminase large subunit [Tsukamurella sp. NPDC003166]|uniref:PBSX family phage terminase large subunit n=1 Tax=Tsukamurella sp. NPDC003166 TaxID=3154444 RepID=UPI0033BF2106
MTIANEASLVDFGLSWKQLRSIAQADALASKQQINLWHGAIRSGKTIGSLVKFLMAIAAAPDHGEIVLIGRTRDTLYRNVIAPMQTGSMFGPLAEHVLYNRGAPTAQVFGRTVHVIGASDARAENVIRGLTVCVAYVDEVSLVSEEFFNQLMGRCSVDGAQVFATTNPDGPRHWLKLNWIDRAAERGHRIFHFSLRDNAAYLPDGLIAAYEAQYTGLWKKRMIDGEWSLADGVIYDMFDPDRHVVGDLPEMRRRLALGIDYGVTNATAGLLVSLGTDRRLYVSAEWAPGPGTEAERSANLSEFVRTAGEPEYVFIDPAAAGFRRQLVADGWKTVFKASNAVLDGIGVVASLLAADRLRIHESCTELIGELPGYVWDSKQVEKGEDAPVKLNDHFSDALRYAIYTSRMLWQDIIPLNETHRQPDQRLEA